MDLSDLVDDLKVASPGGPTPIEDGRPGLIRMPARLVALDEGPDIILDRAMLVVGRHPQCHARLDSIRVSRRHCCMTQDSGDLIVCDLGSTNGIRINGQRVEMGRLHPGDELSIAHIRYRLEHDSRQDATLADSIRSPEDGHHHPFLIRAVPGPAARITPPPQPLRTPAEPGPNPGAESEGPLAAAVRGLLPSGLADRCRIQVIVQMQPESAPPGPDPAQEPEPCRPNSSP